MTFRTRVFIGSLAAATLPLAALGYAASREGSSRMEEQYRLRVADRIQDVAGLVSAASQDLDARLEAVAGRASDDDALRLALVSGRGAQSNYVRDWAESAMRLSGLQMLQLQDGDGVVLSSGHFRSDFGRADPALPTLLGRAPSTGVLVEAATAAGPHLMLVRLRQADVGPVSLSVVGGFDASQVVAERESGPLTVSLLLPGQADPVVDGSRDYVSESLPIPTVSPGAALLDTATVRVRHDLSEVERLRRQTAMGLGIGVLLASFFAALLSRWVADRVTAPLEELARRTARLDLESLNVTFDTGRRDEVGRLSRFMDRMTDRLRRSAARVRSAERRATLGDVARQVNHDVKNAVAPIRNVVRHLDEVERAEPDALPEVFRERLGTLQAGVDYLAELAGQYGKLGAPSSKVAFDVEPVLRTLSSTRGSSAPIIVDVRTGDLRMNGDPLALRRVLENLVGNALDSLGKERGRVTVSARATTQAGAEGPVHSLEIEVADRGIGMDPETLENAQRDFYTTKQEGTGLGLSIVRRLVADLEGTMTIESTPGQGTTVRLRFPRIGAPV